MPRKLPPTNYERPDLARWPAREPKAFTLLELTATQSGKLIDAFVEGGQIFDDLSYCIDRMRGDAMVGGEGPTYVLIKLKTR